MRFAGGASMRAGIFAWAMRVRYSEARCNRSQRVALHYEVDRVNEDWVLSEEGGPESSPHEMGTDVLKHLLLAWAARTQRSRPHS